MPRKRTEEKRPRRKHGTGTVHHRKSDGRWYWETPYINGEKHSGYASSYEEADQCIMLLIANAQKHGFVDSQMSFGQYLLEWIDDMQPGIKANTYYRWKRNIEQRIIPAIVLVNERKMKLGDISLAHLRHRYFQDLVNLWIAEGLSAASVQTYFTPVRAAIIDAIQTEIITHNPVNHIKLPSLERLEEEEHIVLSIEQAKQLIGVLKGHWLLPIIYVALMGLRKGEIIGLKWKDIDFENGKLSIRRNAAQIPEVGIIEDLPKSKKSRRTLSIPDFVLSALTAHQIEQISQVKIRWQAGESWQNLDLVFCRADGSHIRRSTLTDTFDRMLRVAGLPDIAFHDLRHSTATILLALGIQIAIVSKFLGHANPGITMSIYAHVLPGQDGEAMRTYNSAFTS